MDPSVNLRQEQQVDLVDANPTLSGSGSNSEVDAAGFNESKPAQTLSVGPIPKPEGSGILAIPTAKLYSMNGAKRGKVLIFNHETFEEKVGCKDRPGTDQDVARLNQVLPQLGFQTEDIEVYNNISKGEINGIAENLKNNADLEISDCLVVVILTHGIKNDKLVANDGEYHLYEFIENFNPTTLKSMAGKPKLFIIQACRGIKVDDGVNLMAYSARDQVDSQPDIRPYPEFPDLFVVQSSHHGHKAFRDKQEGSWLIQDLCNAIHSCDLETDSIYDILTETNNAISKRLSEAKEYRDKKQIASIYSTLTKKLYFKPSK
ncbi:caspase-7-like [Ochlerotatus camptorhynchus]|uniref:caspase-7-like n=1 Tax=Ochlerotatus camptorhynchus TaxID=644619 RepID=UPI0031DE41B5